MGHGWDLIVFSHPLQKNVDIRPTDGNDDWTLFQPQLHMRVFLHLRQGHDIRLVDPQKAVGEQQFGRPLQAAVREDIPVVAGWTILQRNMLPIFILFGCMSLMSKMVSSV